MQSLEEKIHLKNTFKKVFRAENILPAILIFLLLYSVIILLFGRNNIFKYFSNLEKRQAILNEIKALRKENDQLYKQIDELKHNYFVIEKEARENLGLVKENEEIFIFVGEKQPKQERQDRWIDKVKNIYREYYLDK
ncbi:MAG TPA: septum formation initiator family protein [Persephonella sp.]|nr:septum formation initiator family protein [Hydrogenothermaceae bacterium]HIQ24512.1 septum formation initiator family protein [Persephonella sp.]